MSPDTGLKYRIAIYLPFLCMMAVFIFRYAAGVVLTGYSMHYSICAYSLGISLPLLFSSTFVYAEDNSTTNLETIVVTANRVARTVDDSLASVSIVTRDDIESIQAIDIIDVLRLQVGVNISRTGNAGNQTTLFLRGSESDHALILVDGVRVTSSTTGAFDWSNLPLAQIERIEIVRGSRASLYGSEAIGGVIQIFTRKEKSSYASITLGRYNTKRGSAGFSVGDKTKLSANISVEDSDGFSSTSPTNFSYDPDKDSYKKRGVSLAISHQLNNAVKIGVNVLHHRNKADFDQGKQDARLDTFSTYLQSDMSEQWSQHLRFSHTMNDLESTFNTFKTKRNELDWQHDIAISEAASIIFGANYRKEDVDAPSYKRDINNKSLFATVNHQQGTVSVDVSARYDDHSLGGNRVTGQIASGYIFSSTSSAFMSFGSAFKAPTMNELFSPGFGGSFAGNPDLKPETSKTLEIGLKSRLTNSQHIQLSLYQTDIDDLINFSGTNSQAINIDEASLKGLEIAYSGNQAKWNWGLNMTLQSTKNKITKTRLLRRPNTKANITLGYDSTEKTHVGADITYASSRNDFAAVLDSYTLVNLSLQQQLTKKISLGLRVENVTDEDYELASGYNTSGTAAYVTFNYQ